MDKHTLKRYTRAKNGVMREDPIGAWVEASAVYAVQEQGLALAREVVAWWGTQAEYDDDDPPAKLYEHARALIALAEVPNAPE